MTDVLRAAIAADPEAIENWIVYADWLMDRGDPRGELIALELAIEAKLADDDAIARHRALVRGEEALLSSRLVDQLHHLELELWRSFMRSAHVFGPDDDLPTREVLDALFADPHACLSRALDIGRHTELLYGPSTAIVRELSIDVRAPCELRRISETRLRTVGRDRRARAHRSRMPDRAPRRIHVHRPARRTVRVAEPHNVIDLMGSHRLVRRPSDQRRDREARRAHETTVRIRDAGCRTLHARHALP